ncbi:hepatitis A virus cellular receptor 2 homolog [Archocentrus centrarchus]|uniref:hepatitis A virus cellular receptor 2 homolog n=1 Tax=Archocentrus centrarchus TaxID=63155 RepID=UPI0011EA2C28|nr:hepatitis A virus cellular receptor 2 homolog [Archocentrus centrarchus]
MLNTEMDSLTCAPLRSTLLFVGVFVFVAAEQKNITAESGQNVILPGRAPNNNNILGVEWSRADLGKEYVLLYRGRRFDPENQHPYFVNRVDLQDRQMKDGDVSLILKNVTAADAGTYECRVIQRGSNRKKRANLKTDPISIIYLRVAPPPGPGGGTTEDGGKEDGGKEDGRKEDEGKKDGSVGLIVGLSVPAVLLVSAAVVFLIYRKSNQQGQDSFQPPVELQAVGNGSVFPRDEKLSSLKSTRKSD